MPVDEIQAMSEAEIRTAVDQMARKRFGLSAEQFIEKYRAGEIADCGRHADLLVLADLLID